MSAEHSDPSDLRGDDLLREAGKVLGTQEEKPEKESEPEPSSGPPRIEGEDDLMREAGKILGDKK